LRNYNQMSFFDGKSHDIWVEMRGNNKNFSKKKKKKGTFCVGGGELRLKVQLIPMEELEKVFWTNFADVYDWDRNGVISQMELRLMLEGLGSTITDEKVSTLIQSWIKAHPNKGNEVPIEDIAEIMRNSSEQHLVNMKRCPICSQPITKKSRPQRLVNGGSGKHITMTGKSEGRREREGMHWGKTQWDEINRSDTKYDFANHDVTNTSSFTTNKGHVTTEQTGEITDDIDIVVHVSNCIQEHPNIAFEVSGGFLWDVVEYKGWLQKMVSWSKHNHPVKADTGNMVVKDRESNDFIEERVPPFDKIALRALYTSNAQEREQEALEILKRITTKVGARFSETSSRKHIHPFISFYNIDTSEFLFSPETYQTFNDFFHRKLRPHARPIAVPYNARVAVVPADCRVLVFDTIDRATKLWIKGSEYNLEGLLQSATLAREYENGSVALFRLGPHDAHRFFIPISCTIGQTREIDGEYCTTNPIAMREGIPIPVLNKRTITVLETNDFGDVLYIVVGSTMLGGITLSSKMGDKMKKGDEHGFFSFGGSLLILLFRKNSVVFADDLLANSNKPIETYSKMGTPLAVAKQE